MKETVELERPSGRGSVYRENGTLLGEANYEIIVFQEFLIVGEERTPGLKDIQGWIEPPDWAPIGESLALHLEDGRRLDFFYHNIAGAIADRSGRGLYEP